MRTISRVAEGAVLLAPIRLIARTAGKVTKLFVRDKEFVKTNTSLAVIENPADLEDVFALKRQLAAFGVFFEKPDTEADFKFDARARLGELQLAYSDFLLQLTNYKLFIRTNYYPMKINSVKEQIDYCRNLNAKLAGQKETFARKVELYRKKYGMNQSLFQQGLISEVDLAGVESDYLEKKSDLESAEAGIIQNNVQLAEYEKVLLDVNEQFEEKRTAYVSQIRDSYKKLESELAQWEQKYLLSAPTDGYASFSQFWSENQFVQEGEEVMTIVPGSQKITGKVYLPQMGSGKVKTGQKVNIKLDNYPFREFGILEGKIESISLLPHDNQYLVSVSLPNGLQTSYNRRLEFRQEMQGTAEIITEDLRLIERLFYYLRSLV